MSKISTIAKIRSDGTVVELRDDGTEHPFPEAPIEPMTSEAVEAAAAADPDARPFSGDELQRVKRIPRIKTLRRALGLTQEEFSACYHVPLGTLQDWEQGRTEPDRPARAYLRVIARDPEGVRRALEQFR